MNMACNENVSIVNILLCSCDFFLRTFALIILAVFLQYIYCKI